MLNSYLNLNVIIGWLQSRDMSCLILLVAISTDANCIQFRNRYVIGSEIEVVILLKIFGSNNELPLKIESGLFTLHSW